MKLTVNKRNKKYILNYEPITQLCGTNIPLKKYLLDSICKHFSSEKYKEYEEVLINNIEIDGEVPGRKQWECCRISSLEDVIAAIQMSKSSVLGKCLKEYVGCFDCQNELSQIDYILTSIFDRLNKSILDNSVIQFQYSQEDLFSMIQQTSIRTVDDKDIHELEICELIDVFLEIVSKHQKLLPEKRSYVFENVDHMLTKEDYKVLVSKCSSLCEESNLWFIFSSSLDEYVYISEDTVEGVNVVNDGIYIMPAMEHIIDFVKCYYPMEIEVEQEKMIHVLKRIVQKIGSSEKLIQPAEIVIMKLVNETNDIKTHWENEPKSPEIQCLLAKNVI